MRFFSVLLIGLLLFFFASTNVFAGGFTLESIGALDLQGTAYSHYWYTGTNVVLSGTAPASTNFNLSVDGVSHPLTADASGNWTYTATLTEGDHTVALSANSVSPYTFTLTIGTPPDDVSAISAPQTPAAGFGSPTIILGALGVTFLTSSVYIYKFRLKTA